LAVEQRQKNLRQPPVTVVEEKNDWGEYDLAAEPAAGSGDALLDTLSALRAGWTHVEPLRQKLGIFAALLSRCRSEGNSELLIGEVLAWSTKITDELYLLQKALRGPMYPYEHNGKRMTLVAYAVPAVPPVRSVGDVYQAADAVLDGIYALYMRVMSVLAKRAEAVEESLGLLPLPEPKEQEEKD